MYIGVDVGTGSARACVMNEDGEIVGVASKAILRFQPKKDFVNQSSRDIWQAICHCVKTAVSEAHIEPESVRGIAFDATCSLVATKTPAGEETLPVGPDFSNLDEDVILWMDHRAYDETKAIKATNHALLKFVGGQMSIEMEVPKMMWLKRHMPATLFEQAYFYDLSDWLSMHATGVDARSFCSVACKQGYVPQGVDGSTTGWSAGFLHELGLDELVANDFAKLGGIAGKNGIYHSAGEPVGHLTDKAAQELGLTTKVVVGSGVIDAYSGWIGTVAAKSDLPEHSVDSRLAAVAGTSTCHIVQSQDPVFVPGVWGPYRDVLVSGMWCAEGGQSTTGELIGFIVNNHPANAVLEREAADKQVSKFEILNNHLETMRRAQNLPTIYDLISTLFFYGDLYGNRSPIADPAMRGSLVGFDMDLSLDSLARLYLATLEFVCQQQRQIIEEMNKNGHHVGYIYLSGGQCRNKVLTELMATAAQMPVVIPKYIDSAVVLGTAMLAAKAAGPGLPLWQVMEQYSQRGTTVEPSADPHVRKLLDAKYEIMLDQAQRQRDYRAKVAAALA